MVLEFIYKMFTINKQQKNHLNQYFNFFDLIEEEEEIEIKHEYQALFAVTKLVDQKDFINLAYYLPIISFYDLK